MWASGLFFVSFIRALISVRDKHFTGIAVETAFHGTFYLVFSKTCWVSVDRGVRS